MRTPPWAQQPVSLGNGISICEIGAGFRMRVGEWHTTYLSGAVVESVSNIQIQEMVDAR